MPANPIQVFIDELAVRLQRSIVIDDADVRFLYATAHYGDEDDQRRQALLARAPGEAAVRHVLSQGVAQWTTAGVIPANPDLGMHARYCVPIRWHGELLGLLMVVDRDSTLTADERALLTQAAQDLAGLLVAESGPSVSETDLAVSRAVSDLVTADGALRRDAMTTLAAHLGGPDQHVRVIRLQATGLTDAVSEGHTMGAFRHAVSSAPSHPGSWRVLSAVEDRAATVLLTSPTGVLADPARDLARALVDRAQTMAGGRFTAVAGLGTSVVGLDRARSSFRQSCLAADAAGRALPAAVVSWSELGDLAVLLQLPLAQLDESTLPHEVHLLLGHDKDGRAVETVLAFLDHAGSAPTTADVLHLHRTTLYHRLERIREATGLDLDDGRTRLVLHMGLRLLGLLRAEGS